MRTGKEGRRTSVAVARENARMRLRTAHMYSTTMGVDQAMPRNAIILKADVPIQTWVTWVTWDEHHGWRSISLVLHPTNLELYQQIRRFR